MAVSDLTELAARIKRRDLSSAELVSHYLDRISRINPSLGAYITVTPEIAEREARKADEDLAAGRDHGALHGIPLALKDLVYTEGVRTTAGSSVLGDFVPSYDATLWRRLQAEGAFLLGKLNLHEFAYGTTTNNPHYGPAHNPWDTERIAGGSSGGSAAAVAADLSPGSVGTDTGGSIRIPAACTGIVGLKPTYGRISLHGVVPLAYSLDHAGPMTRSVRDAALLFSLMAGYDDEDPNSVVGPDEGAEAAPEPEAAALRIGVEDDFFFRDADPQIIARVRKALQAFEDRGATVVWLRAPILEEVPDAQNTIISAEALAYHERYLNDSAQRYGTDVRTRLEAGGAFSAVDYARSTHVRGRLRREMTRIFREIDVWLTPTLPILPPPLGAAAVVVNGKEQAVGRNLTRFTNPFNLVGFPALSVPCGLSSEGLPIAVQLVAKPFAERRLLTAGRILESAYPALSPPLFS